MIWAEKLGNIKQTDGLSDDSGKKCGQEHYIFAWRGLKRDPSPFLEVSKAEKRAKVFFNFLSTSLIQRNEDVESDNNEKWSTALIKFPLISIVFRKIYNAEIKIDN